MPQSPWENEEFARLSLSSIDSKFSAGTSQEVDFLEAELRLKHGARVLDLGCGAGRHSIELAKRGHKPVGIDISTTMLAEAELRAEDAGVTIELYPMSLSDLRTELLGEESFDAAICLCMSGLGVLGGEQQDFALLGTVRELLKPGAGFIITGFNALRRYRHASDKMDYTSGRFSFEAPVSDGVLREEIRMYTPSEMHMLLTLAGFHAVTVCGCEPGNFARQPLGVDDIEMMATAAKPSS